MLGGTITLCYNPGMDKLLNWLDTLVKEDLPRNPHPMRFSSYTSLILLFLPGFFFLLALYWLAFHHARFAWLLSLSQYPWEFWGIAVSGTIALIGGAGDWLFHKVYVSVGPKEHHSHELALAAGGSVFVLMAIASLISRPAVLLIPVVVSLLITTVLICYDEFAFHIKRCKTFETILHRLLVFGNGAAFLFWLHWTFVTLAPYG